MPIGLSPPCVSPLSPCPILPSLLPLAFPLAFLSLGHRGADLPPRPHRPKTKPPTHPKPKKLSSIYWQRTPVTGEPLSRNSAPVLFFRRGMSELASVFLPTVAAPGRVPTFWLAGGQSLLSMMMSVVCCPWVCPWVEWGWTPNMFVWEELRGMQRMDCMLCGVLSCSFVLNLQSLW